MPTVRGWPLCLQVNVSAHVSIRYQCATPTTALKMKHPTRVPESTIKTKTKQTQSEWRGIASLYWPPLCAQSRCGKYQPIEMVALPLPPAGIRIVTAVAPIGAASATIRPGRLPQSVPPVLNSAQRSDSLCAVQYVGCGGGGSGGGTFETSAEPPPSRADRSDAAHMERLPACA